MGYFPVLGTWILQGVVSPADPGLSPQVLAKQFQEAETKVVFCCLDNLKKVNSAMKELDRSIPIIVMDMDDNESKSVRGLKSLLILPFNDPRTFGVFEENEITIICWSSGTTGRPKGIQHGSNLFLKRLSEKPEALKWMTSTCMFHMGGFVQPIFNLIKESSSVFLAGEDLDGDIKLLLQVTEKASPNMIACGSHHAIELATMDLPEGQVPITGVQMLMPLGTNVYDGISEDLKEMFPSLIGVLNIYGQSEIYNPVAVCFGQKNLGGLFKEMDALKFVDPETGEAVGPLVVGEFAVKAPESSMLGYLNHQ